MPAPHPAPLPATENAMTDHLEQYLKEPAPAPPDNYLDLLRTALAEALKLSADAVQPAESLVESRYQRARRAAEADLEAARQTLDTCLQTAIASATDDSNARRDDLQRQYDAERADLDQGAQSQHDRVTNSAETRERKVRDNCNYDVLTAENVADGVTAQAEQERQILQAATNEALESLNRLAADADAVLSLYRFLRPAPEPPPAPLAEPPPDEPPDENFRRCRQLAEQALQTINNLTVPRLVVGETPWVILAVLLAVMAGGLALLSRFRPFFLPPLSATLPLVVLATLAPTLWLGRALRRLARTQVAAAHAGFRTRLTAAQAALERRCQLARAQIDQKIAKTRQNRDEETRQAQDRLAVSLAHITQGRDNLLRQLEEDYTQKRRALDDRFASQRRQLEEQAQHTLDDLRRRYERDLEQAHARFQSGLADHQAQYDAARLALQRRWDAGLACLQALLARTNRLDPACRRDWSDPAAQNWNPPADFPSVLRFGRFHADPARLAPGPRTRASFPLDALAHVPAVFSFPDRCSLLLQTRRRGREQALAALRSVILRLFTCLPPGRVRFTLIDPIGLGENFAGFMHAADYDESLVGGRIWTEALHVQQRLADLTDHMENVIQKYLRNEFDSIEQYNRQAGELAEPYRFLVIADFPANFSDESARRLASIINSGPRCGVFTLIHYDARQALPPALHLEDLAAAALHLRADDSPQPGFTWQDPVFCQFPLTLDDAPPEDLLTRLIHLVGAAAKQSARVEVPFAAIAPADSRLASADAIDGIDVPIGRAGAARLQHLRLGQGVAQHLLIAGRTGSGKSTLLHVMITNLALWYSPDQVELYLIDFKHGVEFKTYVTHRLPHARAIAIESDREFGLSILQRLDAEMARRGELFRRAGVQDLPAYRRATAAQLPRTILLVDEFQVFFADDDKLAQDAALLLEQLVRQGRAFGIHVVLGSQTLGGASGLARSTIGQMAVRIALQCAEADAQLILDDTNLAARLLSRPGEAIYNDAGGLTVGNSPFQTAWLSEETRDDYLSRLEPLTAARPAPPEPMIVFEGNAPADPAANRLLAAALDQPAWPACPPLAPLAWLGEPTAIKDPTAVAFDRQSGSHLLIIGQRDDAALALLSAALLSLAAQAPPPAARFILLDATPTDSPYAGLLSRVAAALPHDSRLVEWRDVPQALTDLTDELHRRLEQHRPADPLLFLVIAALHRYRLLRRGEDDFAFSLNEQPAAPRPDRQFAEILREGPPLGLHCLVWADTLAAVERILDRQTLREFDDLVLFQMSAADSSTLIDSPAANQLGFHRALLYSEQRGTLERFRPYAPPDPAWLHHARDLLARKSLPS